jgi:two-component system LytT family sensor kinase
MATYIAADKYRQRAMKERELAQALRGQVTEARFQALRGRLNPHFLFNALNALAMLIRDERPKDAVRFLAGLSDLLRDAVDDSVPPEVPLRNELAFALKYLAVEQIRFDFPLRIDVDVPDAVRDAFVPAMILQPLVENAIRHGIARREGAGTITIEARREGDDIRLAVRDNGGGLATVAPRKGTGLRNVEERLSELYGDAPRFRLAGIPGAFGAVASLAIPYRVSPAAQPAR